MNRMNIALALALSFYSVTSMAQDDVDCDRSKMPALVGSGITQSLDALKCATKDELASAEINSEYEKLASKGITSRNIGGKSFKGSPEELNYLATTLGSHPPKSWAKAKKDCDTVLCALKTIVGSEENAKMLVLAKKNTGYTIKLDQAEAVTADGVVEQLWSTSEIKTFYKISKELPAPLQALHGMSGFYRVPNGYRLPGDENTAAYSSPDVVIGGKVWQAGKVVAYETAFEPSIYHENNHSYSEHAFVHEICHHQDFQNIYHSKSELMGSEVIGSTWEKLSGWTRVAKNGKVSWTHTKADGFVSDYATTQPAEDYAETCSDYVLSPGSLKKASPEKYEWMKKNVFKGEEFLEAKWNTPEKFKPWPELDQKLAAKTDCSSELQSCLKGVSYANGSFTYFRPGPSGPHSSVSYGEVKNAQDYFSTNECLVKMKKDWSAAANAALASDPHYCEQGGGARVFTASSNLCKNDWTKLNQALVAFDKTSVQKGATDCVEIKKDLSTKCVLDAYAQQKGLDSSTVAMLSAVTPVVSQQAQVSQAIKKMSSTKAIKSCVGAQDQAMVGLDPDAPAVYYGRGADTGLTNFQSYDYIAMNAPTADCLNAVVAGLKAEGYSGTDEIKVKSMSTLYGTSGLETPMASFNTMLAIARKKASECTFGGPCQKKALRESMKAWAKDDPEKLALLEDPVFFKKLLGWIKW